jgi:hypothetical protein
MSLATLRVKRLVTRYGLTLVLAFALVGSVLVGAAAMEYTNPPTTEVTDHTNRQTVQSELHTSATTTGETELYDPGTELVDQPVYLFAATPTLEFEQRTAVPANESVHVEQDVSIQYRVTREGTTFWEETRTLAHNETTTSSGTVVATSSLNVSDVQNELDEIRDDVGQAGIVDARLLVTLSYETDRYAGNLSDTASLQLTDDWYSVGGATLEQTHSTPVPRRVPIPTRSPLPYAIPGGVGGLLLVAAGAIGVGQYLGFDEEELDQRAAEMRYREWISTGSVPTSLGTMAVPIDSLEGLVDTAIDTDSRVIHDESKGVYVVIDDLVVYYYSPEGHDFGPPN